MNHDISLKDKHVLVIEFGLHGGAIGTIQWLANQGAHITLSPIITRPKPGSVGNPKSTSIIPPKP